MGCWFSQEQREYRVLKKQIVKTRWKLMKILRKGEFGVVYEVYGIKDSTRSYAMKTEYLKNETGRLPQEALVLETLITLGNASHVPEIFDKGRLEADRVQPKQFIVMTLLGPDLMAVKKISPDHKLSASTVVMIAIQGIDACSVVYNAGFVHRDVKPHNFMIGIKSNKHKIYMIDFGLARRIVDADRNLLKP